MKWGTPIYRELNKPSDNPNLYPNHPILNFVISAFVIVCILSVFAAIGLMVWWLISFLF